MPDKPYFTEDQKEAARDIVISLAKAFSAIVDIKDGLVNGNDMAVMRANENAGDFLIELMDFYRQFYVKPTGKEVSNEG